MLTRLDAANHLLDMIGETPESDLETERPVAAKALRQLDMANTVIQGSAKGWWFNVTYPVLTPQPDTGHILLSPDVTSVDSLTKYPRMASREGKLYDLDKDTNQFTGPIQVMLKREIPFEDLPLSAKTCIVATAAVLFLRAEAGGQLALKGAQDAMQLASVNMAAEHINAAKCNLLETPYMLGKMQDIRGPRGSYGYIGYPGHRI